MTSLPETNNYYSMGRMLLPADRMLRKIYSSKMFGLKVLLLLLVVFMVHRCFRTFRATDTYDLPDPTNLTQDKYDLYISSSYYYPNSTSMGNNSLAMVFNTNFHFFDSNRDIIIIASNGTHKKNTTLKYEIISPHRQCLWVPVYSHAVLLPNMKSLAIVGDYGKEFKIPFEVPKLDRSLLKYEAQTLPIVSCIAPLVVRDEWQTLITSIHVHNYVGSYMHIYWRSVEEHVAGLLREYEKAGYLKLQPWMRADFRTEISNFNVNINMELGNKAAAYTDCLLQYKDFADFVTFLEIEDVIFPRIGESGYMLADDFLVYFSVQKETDIIQMNRVEAKTYMNDKPVDHFVKDSLFWIEMQPKLKTDVIIARSNAINYTWIHPPTTMPKGLKRYNVSRGMTAVLSLTNIDYSGYSEETSGNSPLYNPGPEPLDGPRTIIRKHGIQMISEAFKRMLTIPEFKFYWHGMPKLRQFTRFLKECLYDIYGKHVESGKEHTILCPNADICRLPTTWEKKACGVAKADFTSSNEIINEFSVHYPLQIYYHYSQKCLP